LRLKVNKDVLIPRPETERLVELALDAFAPESRIHVADLGVGSGAIAAAIAKERPHWSIVATDRSGSALRLAEENFRANGLSNIQTRAGDWCAALPPKSAFEMIVSNPPYVAASDPHLQQGDVRYEPPSALTAGPEGMDDLRRIVRQAPKHLKPAGLLFLEHGYNQGQAVRELLQENGFADIETYQDLAGQERVSRGRLGAS
jgi:release factor glutamine methyltransferase